jgi:hypothetical protein
MALFHKAPVLVALLATVPLRDYAGLVLGAYPFQVVLSMAAVWATARFVLGRNDWVKTRHEGVHLDAAPAGARQPAMAERPS